MIKVTFITNEGAEVVEHHAKERHAQVRAELWGWSIAKIEQI